MTRLAIIAAASLLLAGCASFSPDGGFGKVSQLTQERTGQGVALQRSPEDAQTARNRVAELLQVALTADAAVEVALLNNRGLQAKFGDLGIAESELVRAGRLKNPSLSFGRMSGGGGVEIERTVLFDILGLLTMPMAKEVGQQRFEQAHVEVRAGQRQRDARQAGAAADVHDVRRRRDGLADGDAVEHVAIPDAVHLAGPHQAPLDALGRQQPRVDVRAAGLVPEHGRRGRMGRGVRCVGP